MRRPLQKDRTKGGVASKYMICMSQNRCLISNDKRTATQESIIFTSKQIKMKKYDDLMRLVVSGAGYVKAIKAVISNKGSSGVDGMSTKELMDYLVNHWSKTKELLLSGD